MLKYIRYSFAAPFFAASVACLALWGWSKWNEPQIEGLFYFRSANSLSAELSNGRARFAIGVRSNGRSGWYRMSTVMTELQLQSERKWNRRMFSLRGRTIKFPLWYPALVFALASVGVLRFRRQFSIRSALVAATVVAALIGIAVAL
ncbi:hypothetical protein [Lacipirellula limnantheis]|uniref:Uncharacterized protein n=1 Tax=Lacipirellula limnantheis TaxID=2528024 RepID=A0A517TTK9_9BACT|nr:hypothetical protein [Lacipirellula limnantheis]QDT71711.1 hypothetical protein I41_08710 [Lacipirellula limnantheis]